MFVLLLTYTKPLDEVDALMRPHMKWLNEQYAAGRFPRPPKPPRGSTLSYELRATPLAHAARSHGPAPDRATYDDGG